MAKAKKVNYTEADMATMRTMYTGADNKAEIEALRAVIPGKSAASLRAKLASMGLYKAEKAEKEASDKITKEVIATSIGEVVGLAEHEVEGLTKATKASLEKILAGLVRE